MFYFRGPIDFQALIIMIFHSSFPVFLAGYAFNATLIKEKGKNCLSNFQITIHLILCLTLFQEYGVWAINMLNYHLTYTLFMFINSIIFNNFAIAIY